MGTIHFIWKLPTERLEYLTVFCLLVLCFLVLTCRRGWDPVTRAWCSAYGSPYPDRKGRGRINAGLLLYVWRTTTNPACGGQRIRKGIRFLQLFPGFVLDGTRSRGPLLGLRVATASRGSGEGSITKGVLQIGNAPTPKGLVKGTRSGRRTCLLPNDMSIRR